MQKIIQNIIDKRKYDKSQGNPLQELCKLIMNSCYGKTIERLHDKDFKYFHAGDGHNKLWLKNYNAIVEDVQFDDSNIKAVKTIKPIDMHFNFSLLGIQVLSMSKRIMN